VLFNGPAAPLPEPLLPDPRPPDPLLPLESPGFDVEPGLVFSNGPLLEPEPPPDDPPSRVESGVVLGWLPVPVDVHPPLTEQSVFGVVVGTFVESWATAKVGIAIMPVNMTTGASLILGSSDC
jgi:hypothetical protein